MEPLAGSLFRIDFSKTNIRGVPAGVYKYSSIQSKNTKES